MFLSADQNKNNGGTSTITKGIGAKKIEINISSIKLSNTTVETPTNKSESEANRSSKPVGQEEEDDVIILGDEASNEGKPDNDTSNGKQ